MSLRGQEMEGGGWERVRAVVECRRVGLGHHVAEHVVFTLRVSLYLSQSWSPIYRLVLIPLDSGNINELISFYIREASPIGTIYIWPVSVMR